MSVQNQQIALTDIVVDPDLQPRVGGLDDDHIRALREDPETWPPIVVVSEGPNFVLVDGAHRVAAARQLGLEDIAAEIRDPFGVDLRRVAFELNRTHGRALTLRDRRQFAAYALIRDPFQSNQTVATDAALSATTVQAIRKKLEETTEVSRTAYEPSVGARVTTRRLGDLPDVGLRDQVSDQVLGFLQPPTRLRQRRAARFLDRLTSSLGDRAEALDGLSPAETAEALIAIHGESRAKQIGHELAIAGGELREIASQLSGRA